MGNALADVEREKREAQLTLEAKTQALSDWALQYPFVASVTTSCYEVVRRNDLADVVRPTARRRAGLTETEDTSGEGGATGGGSATESGSGSGTSGGETG